MVWSNSSILSEPESTLLSQQGTWEKQVSFGARLMELYITVKNTGSLQLEVMLMTH